MTRQITLYMCQYTEAIDLLPCEYITPISVATSNRHFGGQLDMRNILVQCFTTYYLLVLVPSSLL